MKFRLERKVSRLGWTRWVQPIERGYLMRCCDCGLVHEMNFRVKDGRAQFKARRKQALRARAEGTSERAE